MRASIVAFVLLVPLAVLPPLMTSAAVGVTLLAPLMFVIGMQHSAQNVEIVRTVVLLGRSLNKDVVAEGIETHEQLQRLKQLGATIGQGYLLVTPLQLAHATATVAARGQRFQPTLLKGSRDPATGTIDVPPIQSNRRAPATFATRPHIGRAITLPKKPMPISTI